MTTRPYVRLLLTLIVFATMSALPASASASSAFAAKQKPGDDQYAPDCPPASQNGQGGMNGNGNSQGNGKKCGQQNAGGGLRGFVHTNAADPGSASDPSSVSGQTVPVVAGNTSTAGGSHGKLPFTGAGVLGILALMGVLSVALGGVLRTRFRARSSLA